MSQIDLMDELALVLELMLLYFVCCVQIGLMGLIEWEWIETLATLEPDDVDYTDFVETAKALVPQLQQEVGVCVFKAMSIAHV